MRVGFGYDVHRLVSGRPFVLGGVTVPAEYGLDGHSDADVLTHAVIDAILGALAWGDIGSWFPDTDEAYNNADSLKLLERVVDECDKNNINIQNIDATVVAEKPKLRPYINQIREKLSQTLRLDIERISVKATTSEKMGFIGRAEGVAAHCVILLTE